MFPLKIIIFTVMKNHCILHRLVCVLIVISNFGFEGRILILSVPVSGHCLSFLHYENTPMQNTAIFHGCKNVHFQMNFFLIFAQNIDCGYTLEPPQ